MNSRSASIQPLINADPGDFQLADNVTLAQIRHFFGNERLDDSSRGEVMLRMSPCRGYQCMLELPQLVALIHDSVCGRSTGVDQYGYTKA